MHINDFLRAAPFSSRHQDAFVREIAGVTAAHVQGVVSVGEPVYGDEPRRFDPGYGVTVQSVRGDIWIAILAVVEPGVDTKAIKKEINQRIQAALWNLLEIQAISIQTQLVYRDGVPPVMAREDRQQPPFS